MKNVYILLPSPHPTGPIKGAVALANILVKYHHTSIVFLKKGPGIDSELNNAVRIISLAKCKTIIQKIIRYRKLILQNNAGQKSVSISFCFSADFANLFCHDLAMNISSIRGNLPLNYQYEFGKAGVVVAALHLYFLRWFDHVVAMHRNMARQIYMYCGKTPHIVGNFVDEGMLNAYRNPIPKKQGPLRFIYVGRLTKLKNVHTIINAAEVLKQKQYSFHLDIVGDGELSPELTILAAKNQIENLVTFHGHLKFPYSLMAKSDCLVLPSSTEGVSRSVLEALYLNVPCLVRDIDGNSDLIKNGENGYLFDDDEDLSNLMVKTAELSRRQLDININYLPDNNRQDANTQKLLELINGRS